MTDATATTGPDPDVAAAELALGLLEGEDRAAALRRSLAEPLFAREVERWRAHFATLFAAIPAAIPSGDVEARISARLDNRPRPPLRPQSRVWQAMAFATSLAAAAMFALLMVRPEPVLTPPPPSATAAPAVMVAAFMIEGTATPLVATYDVARGRLSMPGPMPIPAGKSAQLWAIVGTGAPQPLGLFQRAGERVEADARSPSPIAPGTTFAISIEPEGGSPTGLPTGPVIASATLIRA